MWWWVVGAFLLGNENGKSTAQKAATIKQNAMLDQAENMARTLDGMRQKQHQQVLQIITQTALRSQSNAQNKVSSNAYDLEKLLRLPHGTIYNELANNWMRYFTIPGFANVKMSGDFDGYLV